ncbi:hypothetical protein [Streptomyces sp. NPDC001315]|uniref:hypothetical protein n=1 Tax=Streptomyces sp. NPDC001315 TaxID=3364562 RepID=UPI0036992405
MSNNPTGLPGASVLVMTLPKAPLPSPLAMIRDNRDAVQVLIDRTGLPAPTVVPTPDYVHVMLADIDDMAPWLAELDGRVTIDSTPGMRTWTLHTELAATRRRGAVRIEVHALAVQGQDVLPSLRDAAGVAA